ncbi:Protein of unknown function DUF1068 [Dillenia turbinata]|uniref:DUF1068 domain-containing protein n=1 Tax=Dillenia turbinata TaxID=194707 RepID=A0AAN8YXJ0_9MAGN
MAGNQVGPCSAGVIKVTISLMALCLIGYILGPPLYWHFKEGLAAVSHSSSSSSSSCPPCTCDCTSELSLPPGLSNSSFAVINMKVIINLLSCGPVADCAKHDPEVNEDIEKNFAELLTEELKLRESEAQESQQHADMSLLEAKKIASQYQKEADKCNSGMETCEEARERSEAGLAAQKRLTAMWEMRARQKGWKEGNAKPQAQSQGHAQSA